jgi:hypothetical protein
MGIDLFACNMMHKMAAASDNKRRYVLQHVWKTGGSELCRLARANGWKVPPIDGCTMFLKDGWPVEDYDLIGFENGIFQGNVVSDFYPAKSNEIEVHNVKWITILRHPYSRSLSHFYHVWANNQSDKLTMKDFFRGCSGIMCHFLKYNTDQQTRWHCGTWDCGLKPKLQREHLMKAVSNLNKFHVVLILEDMKDPNSCTRLQMRRVLNFTKVQVLNDLTKTNRSNDLRNKLERRPGTRWEEDILPYLDEQGRHTNSSDWGTGSEVMAELAVHNAMDLQLYGYARKRCEDLAAHIVVQPQAQKIQNHLRIQSSKPCPHNYYPSVPLCLAFVALLQLLILHRSRQRSRRMKKTGACN